MVSIGKQLIDPRMATLASKDATGVRGERERELVELWCKRAHDAINRFMEELRAGPSTVLTFHELWIQMNMPRHAWLVEMLGDDASCPPEPSVLQALDTSDPRGAGSPKGSRPWSPKRTGKGKHGDKMSFRRNVASQQMYHKGSETADQALEHGKDPNDKADGPKLFSPSATRERVNGDAVEHNTQRGKIGRSLEGSLNGIAAETKRAVPIHAQALRAAQRAEEELEHGLQWQYDDSLPVASGRASTTGGQHPAMLWKQYDKLTERAVRERGAIALRC